MTHITAAELKQRLETEDIFLLDVREPFEHEAYHIGGMLLPLDTVIANSSLIPKDKPVIVYCKKGIRSQIAIQRLEQKFGFRNLINLQGGMEGWAELES
ncbi:rhodanese-like domain-containing protein [Sediminibacterium soli]|uniref:rhodanese-like domain-containing protein n=1 Tax=Sediminibacterium soli TaxID=2698829 RepID=UPI00137ACBA9|nr:rhodanese-like domain-containing protein [Sediminibacterium soli]NCI47297.1 rhodanese-like domain-containing protein [Sediminibacterium soli]